MPIFNPSASSPLTTKGDIFGFSTVGDRIPVGSNGQVLTADSTQGLGLKWATPSTGTVTSVATDSTLTGGPITTTGTLGINLTNANVWTAKQTFRVTTTPLEIGYDSSNYLRATIGSTGFITLAGTGSGTGFKFTGTANIDTVTVSNPNQNAYGFLLENTTFGTGNSKNVAFLQDNAGRFRIYNNNINAFNIKSDGKVGIGGNYVPVSALDVNGGISLGGYAGVSAASSGFLITDGSIGIGVTNPTGFFISGSRNGGGNNLGINFTNTDVTAGANTAIYSSLTNDVGNYVEMALYNSNATGTFFGIAKANLGRFDSTATFLIGTSANASLIFATNSVETGRFTGGGNFGVGTGATVSAKAHVIAITEQLRLGYDTSNYFSTTISSTGGVTFNAVGSGSAFTFSDSVNITSSLQCDSIVNDTGLAHGTYTPTLTNTTNIDASTARLATYMRVGNTVTVAGQLDIDPTAPAAATLLGISLPIASNFSTVYQAGGTAFAIGIAGMGGGIEADPTNDRVSLKFISSDITNQTMAYSFTYEVI